MNSCNTAFNEHKAEILITSLLLEKERYRQEIIAEEIGNMKYERTADFVAELLYSEDAYIRNIAIEILIKLNEKSLPVLKEKVSDKDRNIRKFALDALKNITGKHSCEIALSVLDDPDENVVEAALEVIAAQSYKEAADKLIAMFEETNSIWIINAVMRAFECLNLRGYSSIVSKKLFSLNATEIEMNILMNTYVRVLGTIGSYDDIELIIDKYSKEFSIDNSNLLFGLCSLIVNKEIYNLPENIVLRLEEIIKENWDYKDSSLLFISMTAFIQLGIYMFLHNLKDIYDFYKGEEFITEKLFDLLICMKEIPAFVVKDMLDSEVPELVVLGLELVLNRRLQDFVGTVQHLCKSKNKEISEMAIRVMEEFCIYKASELFLEPGVTGEKVSITALENSNEIISSDIDQLYLRLEHKNKKVRASAAQILVLIPDKVNIELLEELISRTAEEESMEALEVLFRLNSDIGQKYLYSRMDSMNVNVRTRLIEIMEYSPDNNFYIYMITMINDPSPKVRRKTIKALNKKVDERSLQLLTELYNNEYDEFNKMEIISDIHKFNSDSALKMLMHAANSRSIPTRIAAARSLGFINNINAKNTLHNMLNDNIAEVKEAAAEAIGEAEVIE